MADFELFASNIALNAKEPIVFHYTGAGGTLGIMQSAQMWCTLASHMNDREECKFAHSVAKRIAYTELSKADSDFRTKFMSEFDEQLERYGGIPIYVACFSECEDLLSQWRGYGGKLGYALGFSSTSLASIASKQGFKFEPVKYNNQEHEALLRPIVLELIEHFEPGWEAPLDREKIEKIFRPGMAQIAAKSAIVKHPSFSEEREWRLHSVPFADLIDKTDFVVRGDSIVPIVKFSLETGKTFARPRMTRDICLRGCVVGPGPDQDERSSAIWSVAVRHNVSIGQVMRSAAPLR